MDVLNNRNPKIVSTTVLLCLSHFGVCMTKAAGSLALGTDTGQHSRFPTLVISSHQVCSQTPPADLMNRQVSTGTVPWQVSPYCGLYWEPPVFSSSKILAVAASPLPWHKEFWAVIGWPAALPWWLQQQQQISVLMSVWTWLTPHVVALPFSPSSGKLMVQYLNATCLPLYIKVSAISKAGCIDLWPVCLQQPLR